MRFLLDTDTCSYVIKKYPATLRHFEGFKRKDVGMSVVTCAELYYGAMRKPGKKYLEAVDIFTRYVAVLDWPRAAVKHYAAIRTQLEEKGEPIGELDMMIAAHALSLRVTLVTNNTGHFSRIAALALDNWYV